jgi:hypothetical protein
MIEKPRSFHVKLDVPRISSCQVEVVIDLVRRQGSNDCRETFEQFWGSLKQERLELKREIDDMSNLKRNKC